MEVEVLTKMVGESLDSGGKMRHSVLFKDNLRCW